MINDRLRGCLRQQTGPQLTTGMNLGGETMLLASPGEMFWNKNQNLLRFAVVEGPEGISAYLDMLDSWYSENRCFSSKCELMLVCDIDF